MKPPNAATEPAQGSTIGCRVVPSDAGSNVGRMRGWKLDEARMAGWRRDAARILADQHRDDHAGARQVPLDDGEDVWRA